MTLCTVFVEIVADGWNKLSGVRIRTHAHNSGPEYVDMVKKLSFLISNQIRRFQK